VRLARDEIPTTVDALTAKGDLRDEPQAEAVRKAPIEPKV